LQRLDPSWDGLALARFRNGLPTHAGAGVRVGIIDTGIVASHPALPNVRGRNLVFDETIADPSASEDWMDLEGHGSHVAGIVGARETSASTLKGVAPGVELRAYRVFPRTGEGASNFDIMKAIEIAQRDQCDIINLSLGGPFDEAVRGALSEAQNAGILAVCAAGNDHRGPVAFPAANEGVTAVSAIGYRGTFPKGSVEDADVLKPFSDRDGDLFLAGFSNLGPQIKLTAPGVGIVSTVPGGYAPMSGTSMSTPMVAGLAAALLARHRDRLLSAPDRVAELTTLLYESCVPLGLGRDAEGEGMPLPDGEWRRTLLDSGV
jgi:subtilisin